MELLFFFNYHWTLFMTLIKVFASLVKHFFTSSLGLGTFLILFWELLIHAGFVAVPLFYATVGVETTLMKLLVLFCGFSTPLRTILSWVLLPWHFCPKD
jgi:hypothetical protein